MESTRQSKISRLLQKDLSEIFQMESRNLFQGKMISVTRVRISPDLGLARVYLSIFPSDQAEAVLKEVKIQTKNMRRLLGNRVGKQLRVVPALTFFVDDSLDYIANIDSLLKK
ncbi:30S ribosome-binding factor RbfA [Ancylomarina euxinus]|uniref:Ribosome-binding factor A n=1 Tax=Ancylomarina euxinus TaxID=2283627 RepID=A0A425Y832_9BACT|nr:30S ribosome-binding factor RbfA [Ancylomarina euxinus]MCZ4693473.1 30S ribosome-binding factor RbfA [Ancylomarina euxinus]MUP13700.1 30S ribosome-binding factor RbfA [Ancylomarina euxinus]RRG24660.1 30S ribosome-binding factor RbfA [Ancylomarina euxinus]